MYFLPENEGTRNFSHLSAINIHADGIPILLSIDTDDYICPVDAENLIAAEEYSIPKPEPVVTEFIDLANTVMEENGITSKPTNTDDALKLYHLLKHTLEC